ncbi:MAG: cobyric acid synthase [Candidatus Omnitrophica bacterium]|nr:cobyric acid synthase [Candidatus Omnitrophota bacterium]
MPAKAIMFQGTSSHAGKSVMATAFCRLLSRRGFRVAPFKAMNMSNNASVTQDGGEIATAQAVQAKACGIAPSVEMNPVLLKTMSDNESQIIVFGKPIGTARAAELPRFRATLVEAIEASLKKLIDSYDFLVIEGAGSPAEVNLKATDLANMLVARMAGAGVILVADIERGGVFAQLIGTLELLEPEERDLVQGLLINKFRGDASLLDSGVEWLENRTGRPVFGVIPFLSGIRIPEEDSLGVDSFSDTLSFPPSTRSRDDIRIHVIRYPTISNFTDFDPLEQEPDVSLRYLTQPPAEGELPDLTILPGSKSTMADLAWLRRAGFDRYLDRCVGGGVEVLGVCGGFQMMGQMLYDPSHVESKESGMQGLGLLPISTLFLPTKVTAQVKGIHLESGEPVHGYEIHMGRLQGAMRGKPVFRLTERSGASVSELDGCLSSEKKVWGTYLHGLFDSDQFRSWFLNRLRPAVRPSTQLMAAARGGRTISNLQVRMNGASKDDPYDELADAVYRHLNFSKIRDKIPWMPSL